MAYEKDYRAIYEAVKVWVERGLKGDSSLFGDEALWAAEILEELVACYIKCPDLSDRDFMTKLEEQLAPASPKAKRLVAEIFWAMYLFSSDLKPETKLLKVKRVWEWSGKAFPEVGPLLEREVLVGIGSTGPGYKNYFWLEFTYMIEFLKGFKSLAAADRTRLLAEPWGFAEFLDAQDGTHSRQLRHILAHLLFPETFESISSRGNKKDILYAFMTREERKGIDFKNRQDVDRAMLEVRERLGKEYGPDFDYYHTPGIVDAWRVSEDRVDTELGEVKGELGLGKEAELPEKYSYAKFWIIAPGRNAQLWPEFQARKMMAIGFEEFGEELRDLDQTAIYEKLLANRTDGTKPWNDALAAHEFAHVIKPGDYVLAKRGRTTIVGLGRVSSDYQYFSASGDYHHGRDVEWLKAGEWKLDEDHRLGMKTLTEITRYRELLAYILETIGEVPRADGGASTQGVTAAAKAFSMAEALDGAFVDEATLEDYLTAWRRKKNLILSGAPGTGKSWLARRLAWLLLGEKDDTRLLSLQFHQSYSYEDFVRGWRPGSPQFELVDGPFLRFCELARKDPGRDYVLLIDEINRGNLSRIFGELLSLIEEDKRRPEYAVRLSSPREGEDAFYVPENVRILGTMNSADRSLAVVDYALRRRFAFRKLEPAYGKDEFANFLSSEQMGVDPEVLGWILEAMTKLNEAIAGDRNLGRDYKIGHSYFCSIGDDEVDTKLWYQNIIRGEILPLLEEYWFDEPAKVQEWKTKLTR